MRWVLYLFSLIVFILAYYFSGKAPENAQNLFEIWMITFALVSLDTMYRLQKSFFILFPIVYFIAIIYQYILMMQDQAATGWSSEMQMIGSAIHLILGVYFIIRFFRTEAQDKELRAFYIAAGVGAVFFGSHLISFLADVPTLQQIHGLRLSSYLIIATSGRFLLLEETQRRHPQYARLMPMVILIHVFIVAGKVMQNFVLA